MALHVLAYNIEQMMSMVGGRNGRLSSGACEAISLSSRTSSEILGLDAALRQTSSSCGIGRVTTCSCAFSNHGITM
ncbi:hypothetical protein J5474_10595 [Sagittula sp. M10.9X]|uniref:Uncharacterized protein n=1 Tax=Sagittula salina TaxID=2820268 RepID=A0A940MRY3_9RHOB|nr:hypothetical protein [Sagittula salina]MBP0482937.1 hypothetical protein [Sagittula salina]